LPSSLKIDGDKIEKVLCPNGCKEGFKRLKQHKKEYAKIQKAKKEYDLLRANL
jgi:hypothetical protein